MCEDIHIYHDSSSEQQMDPGVMNLAFYLIHSYCLEFYIVALFPVLLPHP